MRQTQAFSGIVIGGAVSLLATQPVWGAAAEVKAVRLSKSGSELQLILETQAGGENPQISTVSRGNDLVTDIVNTRLSLNEGESFRQENPMPGITSVLVNQLEPNSVRVTVSGENTPPIGQILRQDNQEISLGFSMAAPNQTASQIPEAPTANPTLQTTPPQTQNSSPTPATAQTPAATTPPPQTQNSSPTPATAQTPTQLAQVPSLPATSTAQTPPAPQPIPLQTPTLPPATPGNQTPVPGTPVPAPTPDVVFPNPTIRFEGTPAQPAGAAQPVAPAPPFLPRAVAPPVGDIAIGSINTAPTLIDLGTAVRVPRLVLREAPVREVLALLARSAGLNLAFTGGGAAGDPAGQAGQPGAPPAPGQPGQPGQGGPTITLDIENESVQDVFNYVLQISGLQANRVGRTIFVGTQLPVGARNVVSRSLRLNQVSASAAANFLTAQGAETQVPIEQVQIQTVGEGAAARTIETRTPSILALRPETTTGTLLLRGLSVIPDARLNAVTLIGEPRQVEIASSLLTQLDLRRRQVAVNVRIVDVNLTATDNFNTSFRFGVGDVFINFAPGRTPAFGTATGAGGNVRINPPGNVNNDFVANLLAQIENNNAKILTDPTLVIQEGQTAQVNLTQEIIGNIERTTTVTENVADITVTAEKEEVGVILNVNVDRIDDNGFVTLRVIPQVTSIAQNVPLVAGGGDENAITLRNIRQLDSGLVRLRDNQTLILTGIIQDQNITQSAKVPFLGDIPILGALFRSTQRVNQRSEVIVLLTPQIIDDSQNASFGYNYTPSPDAREVLERRNFPSPEGR